MIFSAIILVAAMVVIVINMAYTGVRAPSNGIIGQGEPLFQILKVETATNMYPGRWVTRGTNNDDVIVGALDKEPVGWLGFEYTPNNFVDGHTEDTIYSASDMVAVYYGGKFCLVASLAAGFNVYKGDGLAGWSSGELMGPAVNGDGGVWLKVPFTNSAAAVHDTGIDIPADIVIADVLIDVTTLYAGSSIEVGFINAVEGGDEDGLVDAAPCTAAVKLRPGVTVTTGGTETYFSANTRGALLSDYVAGTNAASDFGVYAEKPYRTDGTIKSLTYTTSNHACAGNIWLLLQNPTLKVIATAEENKDASSAAADIVVRSII
jgi:hypothetical protein